MLEQVARVASRCTRAGYDAPPTSLAATRRISPRVKCFSTSFCIAAVISMPGASKNWMRTASGSFGLTPTWKPAAKPSDFTRWRATAAGMTRRSATSTPVDATPLIIARLIIRHAGVPSRDATTRSPRFSAVPSAAASWTATSGVRSTLTRPETPFVAEDARRAARLPDEALEELRAGLDLLVRVDPDARA